MATTGIIESPQSGVQRRTDNVPRWRDADMVERWVASARLLTEKHFPKIVGYQDLWAWLRFSAAAKTKNELSKT